MESDEVQHHIQRHIMHVLGQNEWVRYSDMRPEGVESSLYSYHLRELMKTGLIEKVAGKGYRLSPKGMRYSDKVSLATMRPSVQPKIILKLVLDDGKGNVLVYRKMLQPFVGKWNLPGGKLHYDRLSAEQAAMREVLFVLKTAPAKIEHLGVVDYIATRGDELISRTLYLAYHVEVPEVAEARESYSWRNAKELVADDCTLPTKRILELFYAGQNDFFETVTYRE